MINHFFALSLHLNLMTQMQMNKKKVMIPNVTEEVRIGFSFNHMIKVIAETETCHEVQWDFANVTFLHPFFIAPLAIYKNTSGKDIECINMSLRIQSYMNSICFDRMLHFGHEKKEDVESVMQKYTDKTYLPLCSFEMTDSNKDTFGSIMKDVIMKQINIGRGGSSSLCYLISELLDNIYEPTLKSGLFRWNGTVILMRIPVVLPQDFNYIDYLE